jgi:hypothetical protein
MDNNIYSVLNDLQNNHRRYLNNVADMVDILRNERDRGFRNSVRRAAARAQTTSTTPTTTVPLTTVPLTTRPPRTIPSMSSSIASQILSMLASPSTDSLTFEFLLNSPTDSSVDISNNTTVYVQPELEEPLICPITLEPIEAGTNVMKITRCGHVFKESSLRQWLIRDQRCPVCRGGL